MTAPPTLEDVFSVMSAASFGESDARVALPEVPEMDHLPTRLGVGLNVLLDDLAVRAKAAQLSAERLRILASAAHDFASATFDLPVLFDMVALRLAETVKDLCAVLLLSEDGKELVPVACRGEHADDEKHARIMFAEPVLLERHPIAKHVQETGDPFVLEKIDLEFFRQFTTPKYFKHAQASGMHSMLIVPLRVQGRIFGQLALVRFRDRSPSFAPDDVNLVRGLGDHAALAIANAKSYASERLARLAAEKAKDDHLASEARRLKLEEQLRQSQKMEAIGRLAGGIAHDFNNVLSVILSYGEMALASMKPGEPIRDDIEEMRAAARRAADLTRQLLMFSRKQVLEPKVIDLNDFIAGMNKMFERILGADVDLVSVFAAKLGRVRIDPSSAEQILMNLVVNARDAMPVGGKLTIETANVTLDEAYAHAHIDVTPGQYVMLAVTDNGVGMEQSTVARVFEPFFTTKESGKGTGLGLATVFGIVQQSGGSVWVYSEMGKGTTFKIYLPRVDSEVDVLRPVEVATMLRGTETVLLVEDNDQVRALANTILRKSGYLVIEARNAGEALLHAEKHPGTIHLLLSDVVMPQMSGPELAHRLASVRPSMKVLCMSGYTDDSIFRHGIIEEQVAYLQKPFTPETLTTKVRDVLDGVRR